MARCPTTSTTNRSATNDSSRRSPTAHQGQSPVTGQRVSSRGDVGAARRKWRGSARIGEELRERRHPGRPRRQRRRRVRRGPALRAAGRARRRPDPHRLGPRRRRLGRGPHPRRARYHRRPRADHHQHVGVRPPPRPRPQRRPGPGLHHAGGRRRTRRVAYHHGGAGSTMGPAWPARSTPPPCPRDSATPTSAATPTPGNAWDQQGWTHAITQLGIEAYFDAAASRRDVFSYEAVAIDPGDVHRRERSIEVFRARRAPSHSSLAQTQATGSPSTRPRPPGGPALGVRVGAGYQRCDPASGSTGTGAAARSRCWRRALFRCCRIRHGWSAVWSALLVTGWRASHRARPARQRARRRCCGAAGVWG